MGKIVDADELYAAFRRDIMGGLNYDRILREAKPVDAVPVVHGRWKHKKDLKQFFCDQCGEPSLTEDDVYFYGMEFPNFCPNCGADMRKDGEAHGTK